MQPIKKLKISTITLLLPIACFLTCCGTSTQAQNITWIGTADTNWDTTSLNWAITGGTTANMVFASGDNVTFDNNGQVYTIGVTNVVTPSTVTVNSSQNYTFSTSTATPGGIGGAASLVNNGSGTLTLMTSNSYTGPTVINQGTVELAGPLASLGLGPVTNNGTLVLSNSNPLVLGNTITGTGNLLIDGGGFVTFPGANTMNASNITLEGGTTLFGPGALGNSTNLFSAGSATTTFQMFNAGASIGSAVNLTISNSAVFYSSNNDTWSGQINLQNGSLSCHGTGSSVAGAGGVTIGGTIEGTPAGLINFYGGSTNICSATINTPGVFGVEKTQSGVWLFNGSNSSYKATAEIGTNAGVIHLGSNNAMATNSYFFLGGSGCDLDLEGYNQTFCGIASTNSPSQSIINAVIGNGSANGVPSRLTILPSVSPDIGTNMVYGGRLRNQDGKSVGTGALSLTVDVGSGGSLTLDGAFGGTGNNTFSGDITVNSGTLFINGSATFPLNPSYIYLADGTTLDVSGSTAPTVTVNTRLEGDGAFNINGNLSINNSGTVELKLDKTGSVLTNDLVNVNGLILFGGTLQLDITGTTPLASTDTFQIFNATEGYYNGFTNFVPATPGPGLAWNTNNLATDGVLGITSTGSAVNANPTNIVASVSGGSLTLSWPADHTGWMLQSQTNTLGVGISTNWVDVPNSTSTNQVILSTDPANGSVFFRMVYP